jgi:TolB protein
MNRIHLSSSAFICGFLALLITAVGQAQRQPVLPQIKVPHPYYYREMYLPQVTTGPSGAAWSPDGQELIYSMQGTLWRQRVGSTEARQITDTPGGYDYQPDWSPDGRRVVFVRYDGRAMSLRMLDLESGTESPLVENGAVNVDPRWSPDGGRIAYVSTEFEGRWHIYLQSVKDGLPALSPSRLSADHDSGLPRYYYSRYDHYLSPAWSPDGTALIVLSNRDHIWGTGGLWRMPADTGGRMTLLHDEETNWRTHPDWERGGHRVVYASYLGRQWHQLWLMTDDGSNPFQLTYGEWDATNPRWSPDGSRIAFIANEGGNTSLRIVTVPGGRQELVRAATRQYLNPHGSLRLTVLDDASGRPIPARISVWTPDGRSWAPDDALRRADDSFDPAQRPIEYGYFHAQGSASIPVPAGEVQYEVSRGPEYAMVSATVTVKTTGRALVVRLRRIANLPATGWYSGDLHVHMNYGGWYRNTPALLGFQARAEDVHVVEDLIVNKEGRVPDVELFTGKPDPVSSPSMLLLHDEEFHTSYWGHTGLLGLTTNLVLPGYAAYAGTAAASLWPTNAEVHDLAAAQGGISGYVHPFDSEITPSDTTTPLRNEFPVDVALGKVDYYEALGFVDDYRATAQAWYRMLNCGFRIPAGAGTDAMANYASFRGPVGMNRVFVQAPGQGPLTRQRFYAGLKAGRTFATNGPLLEFSLGGQPIGGEVKLGAGSHSLTARVRMSSYVLVEHLEIVGNGRVIATLPLKGNRTRFDGTVTIPVTQSGWYLLRATGDTARDPVLDFYPYATTSPIYVTVAGQPIRSREDAEYFLAWIDRLERNVLAFADWNSPGEQDHVLEEIRSARAVFQERAKPDGQTD